MSWIQKLYETYEMCAGNESIPDADDLCPVGYSTQNAHIEVVLDGTGNFRRASLVQKENNPKTMIPVTESSAGRTSGEDAHPLCDSLQYCAGDYLDYGGRRESFHAGYVKQLKEWVESKNSHHKVQAVYSYVQKKSLIKNLVSQGLLAVSNGVLVVEAKEEDKPEEVHPIFKLLTFDSNGIKDQAKVFIRWSVETDNDPCPQTWKDKTLHEAWRLYLDSKESKQGFCYVTGCKTAIAQKHPAKLRNGKDGAKLISSNDTAGYTFLGRFLSADHVASVSSEITQKAHSALRWLIGRKQAFRSGGQVFVSWSVAGKHIPDPWADSFVFLGETEGAQPEVVAGDVGQFFARKLSKAIAGYKANLSDSENIIVMGIDSAADGRGRMAITYYRELTGSEFLARVELWHADFAWQQNFGKEKHFIGAPSPRDIAHSAYGSRVEGKNGIKFLNSTVARLLPCIVDGVQFPRDLVESCVRRASNRVGLELWEWHKCIGIACSLYRGTHKERGYHMALEEERKTRDYLYGRLLAVAERIESSALRFANEKRDTMAARLMQRFADRPFSTWRTIETSLTSYKSRINAKMPGLLAGYQELLDVIHADIVSADYITDERLSGEYLLGYHCQRDWFKKHKRENGKWVLKAVEEVKDGADDDE